MGMEVGNGGLSSDKSVTFYPEFAIGQMVYFKTDSRPVIVTSYEVFSEGEILYKVYAPWLGQGSHYGFELQEKQTVF